MAAAVGRLQDFGGALKKVLSIEFSIKFRVAGNVLK
jgi:hypothetical protein